MRALSLPLFPCALVASLLFTVACDQAASVERTLDNRLYDGAPPTVPHSTEGRSDCLTCHADGDALEDGKRAAVTPHPELEHCIQCHVPQQGVAPLVAVDYTGASYPNGPRAHAEAPPMIPHPLTLRENCVACHGPDGTDETIRTTHPERIRCQQCHVPAHEGWPGPRPDLETDPWQAVP